ncbi:MAG: HD domain-containing protein [Bacilli bacterium]|nr:HD domain-containing protein [Bacilli bacterium]
MSKAKKVIDYYVLCNKLKDVVRTGWKDWKVNRERVESIAEHIFGVQMLAIAIKSEYKRDIDISKVIFMLAVHELEEIFIGDLTQFQISREEKKKIGAEAVRKVLAGLLDKEQIASLIDEFDARETEEAKVAYFCDKLECDLQCKLYDEEGCVDLHSQEGNTTLNNSLVQELLSKGCSWSEMWLEFGQRKYNYDEDFMEVSNYAKTHKIKL